MTGVILKVLVLILKESFKKLVIDWTANWLMLQLKLAKKKGVIAKVKEIKSLLVANKLEKLDLEDEFTFIVDIVTNNGYYKNIANQIKEKVKNL